MPIVVEPGAVEDDMFGGLNHLIADGSMPPQWLISTNATWKQIKKALSAVIEAMDKNSHFL